MKSPRQHLPSRQTDAPPILDTTWDGKYGADGARAAFDPATWAAPLVTREEWRANDDLSRSPSGTLIEADNLAAGCALLPQRRGTVRLIYIDPPFNIGRVHHAHIARTQNRHGSTGRPRTIPAYDDRWGSGAESFAHHLWLRLRLARELLSNDGSLFLHTNDHTAPLARALLDDVFGPERFLNEIVWHYTGGGRSRSVFSNKHDLIYWYAKSRRHLFNLDAVREPYKPTSGYARSGIRAASGKRYLPHPDGTPADDVWDMPMVNPMASERCGYPTQKPLALLERIVAAASRPGDVVADLYAGSGTTAIAAARLGRRWLAFERSPPGSAVIRRRLLEANAVFDVMGCDDAPERKIRAASATLARRNGQARLARFAPRRAAGLSDNERRAWQASDDGLELVACWGLIGGRGEPVLILPADAEGATRPKQGKSARAAACVFVVDVFGRRWAADCL